MADFTVTYDKVDALQLVLLQDHIHTKGRIDSMPLTLGNIAVDKGLFLPFYCIYKMLVRRRRSAEVKHPKREYKSTKHILKVYSIS